MKALDLTGQRFGRWHVLRRSENLNEASAWLCRCDCGTERVVRGSWMNKGKSLSCGCLIAEVSRFTNRSHGMKGTKEYKAWDCMKQRCLNPKHKSYASYGGAGITICESWLLSFESFFKDMGFAPSRQHSIDRIKGNLGYSPDNCRWATAHEQSQNRSDNVTIKAFGESKVISEWARDSRCAVNLGTLGWRIRAEWNAEKAISQPARKI